jgi:hypothetical protein
VTADSGARWSLMPTPAIWLPDFLSRLPQVGQVLYAGRAGVWLYGGGNIWVTRDGEKSWHKITLPGTIETMAAGVHAVYAIADNRLYRSPLGRDA